MAGGGSADSSENAQGHSESPLGNGSQAVAGGGRTGSVSDDRRESARKGGVPHVVYGAPLITPTVAQALALRAGRRGRNLPFEPVLRQHGW